MADCSVCISYVTWRGMEGTCRLWKITCKGTCQVPLYFSLRFWMRHVILDATCHFGCDMSFWMRHVILDATCHFGCDMSFWMRRVIFELWNVGLKGETG